MAEALYFAWWRQNRPGWVDPAWYTMPVRHDVLRLLDLPAGPDLLAALQRHPFAHACSADHGEGMLDLPAPGSGPGFPCGCTLVLAAAWQGVAAWAAVEAARAVVAAAGQDTVELPARSSRPAIADPAREEIAAALRVSPRSAATAIAAARDLTAHPEAAALAAEGLVPLAAVRRVCHDTASLDPEDAAAVVSDWVQRVRRRAASRHGPMTGQGARACASRLIIKAPSHRRLRTRARAGRRVEMWSSTDGTATVSAVLREEDAARVHSRLTAMARGLDDPDDLRPLDAKRADLLVDLLLGRADSAATGVELQVIVPLAALLAGDGVAEIAGVGPVAADTVASLAADARWRALLTDTADRVVATSAATYRPPEPLARLIRAREPHCRMPGCRTAARRCDLDHAVPYPQGATSFDNLGPLCRRHHLLKTHTDWDLIPEQRAWRTPAGARYPYGTPQEYDA